MSEHDPVVGKSWGRSILPQRGGEAEGAENELNPEAIGMAGGAWRCEGFLCRGRVYDWQGNGLAEEWAEIWDQNGVGFTPFYSGGMSSRVVHAQ